MRALEASPRESLAVESSCAAWSLSAWHEPTSSSFCCS